MSAIVEQPLEQRWEAVDARLKQLEAVDDRHARWHAVDGRLKQLEAGLVAHDEALRKHGSYLHQLGRAVQQLQALVMRIQQQLERTLDVVARRTGH